MISSRTAREIGPVPLFRLKSLQLPPLQRPSRRIGFRSSSKRTGYRFRCNETALHDWDGTRIREFLQAAHSCSFFRLDFREDVKRAFERSKYEPTY